MREEFLLDTSVIRATSMKNLNDLSNMGHGLFVSPYSFWEILCHLDEKQKYEYFKSQLTKFKFLNILDDPFGVIAKYLEPYKSSLNDRIKDDELIHRIIAALDRSNSIDKFYSYVLEDSKRKIRKIEDCATRGREILKNAADRYVNFVQKIIITIKENNLKYQTNAERHDLILSLIDGWVRRFESQNSSNDKLGQTLIIETYIYFSCVLHRALQYLIHDNLNIDENDYEDSQICLHLSLDSKLHFLAGDKNYITSINQTLKLLKQLNGALFHTSIQVSNSDYLNNLIKRI